MSALATASRRLTAAWQAHDQSPTAETSAEVEAARAEHDRALREHLAASWSVAAIVPEPQPAGASATLADRVAAHRRWLRGEPGGARFVVAWREDLTGANLTRANLTRANLPRANLADANLSGADLTRANLSGANLAGANLADANLADADLAGANLAGAYLAGANLTRADLSGADLSGADLAGAYLSGAYLSGADLSGADLAGANLAGAYLTGANLAAIRSDVRRALDAVPAEVPGLLAAFRDGRINGSAYEGDCACFVGTVAKLRGCYYRSIPGVQADPSRPLERFVGAVRRGDTPATNPVSAMVERWIVEWMSERAEVAS